MKRLIAVWRWQRLKSTFAKTEANPVVEQALRIANAALETTSATLANANELQHITERALAQIRDQEAQLSKAREELLAYFWGTLEEETQAAELKRISSLP